MQAKSEFFPAAVKQSKEDWELHLLLPEQECKKFPGV